MTLIRRIQKYSIYVGIVGMVLIAVITRNPGYVLVYVLGVIASNISFFLNYRHVFGIDVEGKINIGFNIFALRLLVYAVVLVLAMRGFGMEASIFALVGCLSIRFAILVQEFL